MPMYRYECEHCGWNAKMLFDSDRRPKTIKCRECKKRAEYRPSFGGVQGQWKQPVHSVSAGVLPHQIPDAMALDKKLGVHGVRYDKKGSPIFGSRRQQRQWCRAHRWHNRDDYF